MRTQPAKGLLGTLHFCRTQVLSLGSSLDYFGSWKTWPASSAPVTNFTPRFRRDPSIAHLETPEDSSHQREIKNYKFGAGEVAQWP